MKWLLDNVSIWTSLNFLWAKTFPPPRLNDLVRVLGVKAVESHPTYLGLPTIIGWSKKQIFNFFHDLVWKKIKGWKERSLSMAGRKVLIKSIVQSIPSYVRSCFLFLVTTCSQIDSMTSCFFWGGDDNSWKIHWLSWDKLSHSKREGGLGFRISRAFDMALLSKQWWRILCVGKLIVVCHSWSEVLSSDSSSLCQGRK